jgi:hypothetical protein
MLALLARFFYRNQRTEKFAADDIYRFDTSHLVMHPNPEYIPAEASAFSGFLYQLEPASDAEPRYCSVPAENHAIGQGQSDQGYGEFMHLNRAYRQSSASTDL